VLKGVALEVGDGEFVTVIGANGAGKSTLFLTISGFVHAAQGTIEYNGKNIIGMDSADIVRLGICQVPEGRQLFPMMTVKENLEMGAYLRKDKKTISQDLEQMYQLFPRLKERTRQQAGTLSGGEQQMLAIARGLMSNPKLLLLDEPSLGLSPVLVETLFDIIKEIKSRKITILLNEQNAAMALRLADRGYVLEVGNIVLEGTGKELLNNDNVRKSYLGM
jgi:branched-chain amino acid transport system ATP-binding protein